MITRDEIRGRLERAYAPYARPLRLIEGNPLDETYKSAKAMFDLFGLLPEWPKPKALFCTDNWEVSVSWETDRGHVEICTEKDASMTAFVYHGAKYSDATDKKEQPLDKYPGADTADRVRRLFREYLG